MILPRSFCTGIKFFRVAEAPFACTRPVFLAPAVMASSRYPGVRLTSTFNSEVSRQPSLLQPSNSACSFLCFFSAGFCVNFLQSFLVLPLSSFCAISPIFFSKAVLLSLVFLSRQLLSNRSCSPSVFLLCHPVTFLQTCFSLPWSSYFDS